MKITCGLQKVDFFIDKIEELGEVNLDQGIDIFQNFPFEQQLKEASDREDTSCSPTVIFKDENGNSLHIWANDNTGFSIHYNNGNQFSNFIISNDFIQNPQGLAVEQFIELFFQGKIENALNLVDKENNEIGSETILQDDYPQNTVLQSDQVSYSFQETKKFKYYLWTLPWLLIALYLFNFDWNVDFQIGWGVHLLFSLAWLPGTILHISYWFKNEGVIVMIDTNEKTLSYVKNGLEITFKREDIKICEINESRSTKAPWNGYSYIWFVLNNKEQIVITNFICKPEIIIDLMKPNFRINKRAIPFLSI